jgi:hypothetical protein
MAGDPKFHKVHVERVRSPEYGDGTVVADLGPIGVQIMWDRMEGAVGRQLLTHDRSFVERLERI